MKRFLFVVLFLCVVSYVCGCKSFKSLYIATWNIDPISQPSEYYIKRAIPDVYDIVILQGVFDKKTEATISRDEASVYRNRYFSPSISSGKYLSCSSEYLTVAKQFLACIKTYDMEKIDGESYETCSEQYTLLFNTESSCLKCLVNAWNNGDKSAGINTCLGGKNVDEFTNDGRLGIMILSKYALSDVKTTPIKSLNRAKGVITFTVCDKINVATVYMDRFEPLPSLEDDTYDWLSTTLTTNPDIVIGEFGFGNNHRPTYYDYFKGLGFISTKVDVGPLSLSSGTYCPSESRPGCSGETPRQLNHIFISTTTSTLQLPQWVSTYPFAYTSNTAISKYYGLSAKLLVK